MRDIRKSPEYQRWRQDVKKRDENICRICGVERNLHVHHIKPLATYPQFAIDLDNGLTLCGNCHSFLSGKEENTNLQTLIEAMTGQRDTRTVKQLKRLNDKFCSYLDTHLKMRNRDIANDAVYKMFAHLQTYPDSLDQFLQLVEYILDKALSEYRWDSKKRFEDEFAKRIAIEFLKNHPSKTASQILSKYENLWSFQSGKHMYLKGNYAAALEKFEPLAEIGHVESQYYLGVMSYYGKGIAQNHNQAIKWIMKAAEQGYSDAQFELGQMYSERNGVDRDDREAIKWYRKAAEQGNRDAYHKLCVMYAFGRGAPKKFIVEPEEVPKKFIVGPENVSAQQIRLCVIYEDGEGPPQSFEAALEYYRKAVDEGDADAQYKLGEMYENGKAIQRDDIAAVKWYRKAAEQGDADAYYKLGEMYENGKAIQRDFEKVVEWYQESAYQGDADAYHILGDIYENGRGVQQDDKEAFEWYRKAAEQGYYPDACYKLGVMYEIQQDDEEAFEWYNAAKMQLEYNYCSAEADVYCKLGVMYENGKGVQQNYKAALKWYRKAEQLGCSDALSYLINLEQYLGLDEFVSLPQGTDYTRL